MVATLESSYFFTINDNKQLAEQSIALPSGWEASFPALTALLYLFTTNKDLKLGDLKYQSILNFDVLWKPILYDTKSLSPYDFPPEILAELGNTLELQAALMLIHVCTSKKWCLTIRVPTTTERRQSRLFKIINQTTQDDEVQLGKTPTQLLALKTITTTSSKTRYCPTFQNIDEVRTFRPINRHLLAYWVDDKEFFKSTHILEENEECNVLQVLSHYEQHQQRIFSPKITSPLARYYIFTSTFASDEVVIDKLFIRSYANTKNEVNAEIISLYAHIKCALTYPTEKLNSVLKRCKEIGLDYWLAYFLAYGQVVHSYNEGYNREMHFSRLTEAFHIYRRMGSWAGITRALHAKSTLLSKERRLKNANKYLEICFGIRQFLQDELGIARLLNGLSYLKSQLEEFESAIQYTQKSINHLSKEDQFEELAFTYAQISWFYLLSDQYPKAIEYGMRTINTMTEKNIRTLPFRTKPDIHAQLGLCYAFNGDMNNALQHSDYCESHKVDSTATGDIIRILLRAIINDDREETYLSDISYNYIPELLESNPNVDPHLELIYYRILVTRYQKESDDWKVRKFSEKGKKLCLKNNYQKSLSWFE